MNLIENVTNDANQILTVVLADGTPVILNLIYRPTIQRWSVDVNWNDSQFQANGINVCVYPNMLQPWEKIIPFGLACVTIDGGDPVYIDDFTNGRASFYLLDQADVLLTKETYLGAGV